MTGKFPKAQSAQLARRRHSSLLDEGQAKEDDRTYDIRTSINIVATALLELDYYHVTSFSRRVAPGTSILARTRAFRRPSIYAVHSSAPFAFFLLKDSVQGPEGWTYLSRLCVTIINIIIIIAAAAAP
jgi:hypothetical protein